MSRAGAESEPRAETRKKAEVRNPKSNRGYEGRIKPGGRAIAFGRKRKPETQRQTERAEFGFRISDFGLLSAFGLRPSHLQLPPRCSLDIAYRSADDLIGGGQTREHLADTIFPQGTHAHFTGTVTQD